MFRHFKYDKGTQEWVNTPERVQKPEDRLPESSPGVYSLNPPSGVWKTRTAKKAN